MPLKAPRLRAGDTVLHYPSSTEYVIAYVDDRNMFGAMGAVGRGFRALVEHCDIVRRCSDAEHLATVLQALELPDERADYVARIYTGHAGEGEV